MTVRAATDVESVSTILLEHLAPERGPVLVIRDTFDAGVRVEHDVKQPTMADVVDGARTVSVALAAEESARSGNSEPVRQWDALEYKGNAPLWALDDHQGDILREYVPLVSRESREQILGRKFPFVGDSVPGFIVSVHVLI